MTEAPPNATARLVFSGTIPQLVLRLFHRYNFNLVLMLLVDVLWMDEDEP